MRAQSGRQIARALQTQDQRTEVEDRPVRRLDAARAAIAGGIGGAPNRSQGPFADMSVAI